MDVPYVDLAAAYRSLKEEIDAAVAGVLASGAYVLGENVAAFEEEFCRWVGASQAVAVGSGTDAIYLTLKALDIGAGDEVITVSHTAVNTALAISKTGATPVLVDIDPETFCLDPSWPGGGPLRPAPAPSCRSTSTAIPSTWTRCWNSPRSTACR